MIKTNLKIGVILRNPNDKNRFYKVIQIKRKYALIRWVNSLPHESSQKILIATINKWERVI